MVPLSRPLFQAFFTQRALLRLGSIAACAGVLSCGSPQPALDSDGNEPDLRADDLLFDDFEDGEQTTALGTPWYHFTDRENGGGSELSGTEGASSWIGEPGYESSHALSVEYSLSKEDYQWEPYVAVAAEIPADVSVAGYQGLSYAYRGGQHTVRVETSNVSDYDFFSLLVPASSEWTIARVPFDALRQAGYGVPVEWDAGLVKSVSWVVTGRDGQRGALSLDDIYFDKVSEVDRGEPDLLLREPAPPAPVELGSLEIPGALQRKVLAQLDRGYNLTNWLEERRFSGFEYDEAFVERLAAAGFRGLRLPIDLDLYVTDKAGSGDALELTLHEDLFTVLDSFDAWTLAHGLSFTIDYHQYDGSLDLNDAASVDEVTALWRAVARHFSSSARDDLYFELMNEPELSSGASAVLQAGPWTAAAERLIAAIREEDTTHTILFGDVNWYGIEELSRRVPFSDDNVAYAFHFYEPFIFTHQGANWAEMATTHDVPFPYSVERWSEHSSDLGVNASTPTWIRGQFQNYYRTGFREALWNRIALAKSWAVEHGVPILCNEFGVYDRTSRLEDRARYYTDLIDVFAELEIPWQHWFMILEDDGTILPEYREALRLGD